MQVTETLSQGLKREFKVVLPATELEERLNSELTTLKDRVQIKGFRPGKVPVGHLRRVYGRSVMADVLQNAVNEANRKIVEDNDLKLANEPQIQFPESQEEVEKAMEAKGDLAFTVALEVLPVFELADLSDVSVTKPVAEVTDAEINESLERMAKQNRSFETKEGAAADGDRVVVDFVGRIDGTEFEGGKGEDIRVELGSNTFIPGFEDQLLGLKAGDTKLVKVTFPVNYMAAHLAGKEAEFDVTVKEVEAPGELKIDDEMAKGFGMESLDKLKDAIRDAIKRDFDAQSRRKVKKDLLDSLDSKYSFELPPTLVEQEFSAVWAQVVGDMKSNNRTFEDESTTEDEAKAEYRKIAERRVRLGLVLAQIGEKSDIKISDDEVTQALIERVRQYPGQERQVWEFYQKNPQALAEIRAPLFEEKVVDQILSQVKVNEETVSKDALFNDEDEGGEKAGKGE
ncbi:trigger factor [Microvirga lotononidis]|uniref:Trigger factor n=1 Tax=Microvirga lotononidis TaxID=864069 RepID=I4YZV7_9HYPH|nr:trigger factor [Microvirga lotononidis]EIM29499.1 trigger factor [Microvirga lotononidis]WQO29898.1 trigger factor [Microvirga lotononidis]